jgi:hypothetical protein
MVSSVVELVLPGKLLFGLCLGWLLYWCGVSDSSVSKSGFWWLRNYCVNTFVSFVFFFSGERFKTFEQQ